MNALKVLLLAGMTVLILLTPQPAAAQSVGCNLIYQAGDDPNAEPQDGDCPKVLPALGSAVALTTALIVYGLILRHGYLSGANTSGSQTRPRSTGRRDPHIDPSICFPAETLVATPAGPRPIQALRVGETLLGWDASTGSVITTRVLGTSTGSTSNWVDVHLIGAVIRCTPSHPFWVDSEGCWLPAGELESRMSLLRRDGSATAVESIHRVAAAGEPTYNLNVERTENYFVGALEVLVHNITWPWFFWLDRPGYSNYFLIDRTGHIYYCGIVGPNETDAGVKYRHANNHGRFRPGVDRFVKLKGTRTYGQARVAEQLLSEQVRTMIGRDGTNYRGNRQRPMAARTAPRYQEYQAIKRNCR